MAKRLILIAALALPGAALADDLRLKQVAPRVQSPALNSTSADRQRLSRELRDFRAAEQPFTSRAGRRDQLELDRLERELGSGPTRGPTSPAFRPEPRTRLLDKGPRQIELDLDALD